MHKPEESEAAPQVSAASLQVHEGSQARQRLRHGVSLSHQQDVAQACMSHAVVQAQQCAVLLQHRASHLSVCWQLYTLAAQALIKSDCCAVKIVNTVLQMLYRIRQMLYRTRERVSCGNAGPLGLCVCSPA